MIPIAEMVIATRNMMASTLKNIANVMGMLSRGLKSSIMAPWNMAIEEPPRSFPTTIEVLEIGATRISLRNPNSRSQTIDIALKKEVKSTVIPTIPGNIKSRKSLPPPPPKVLKELAIPVLSHHAPRCR
ncbi:MAG TPA: hypothetical protein VIH07_00895 [Candidatus Humimicrobiaceae bacterium]